jgi:hypothetical protein
MNKRIKFLKRNLILLIEDLNNSIKLLRKIIFIFQILLSKIRFDRKGFFRLNRKFAKQDF